MPCIKFLGSSGRSCRSIALRYPRFHTWDRTEIQAPWPLPTNRRPFAATRALQSNPERLSPLHGVFHSSNNTLDAPQELESVNNPQDIKDGGPGTTWCSKSSAVLHALDRSAQKLYFVPTRVTDTAPDARPKPGPTSETALSTRGILTRYLLSATGCVRGSPENPFNLSAHEAKFLEGEGFSLDNVLQWAASLSDTDSLSAATIFRVNQSKAPLFLLLLFLRRRRIGRAALSILLQHLDIRLRHELLGWEPLKILITRLLWHARLIWPECMPWIAHLFTTQANELLERGTIHEHVDLTHFCNRLLLLLSVPAGLNPIKSAAFQQKAQSQVLSFMATQDPPIIVTRTGFRATIRTQLAHSKTAQERDWGQLKATSWPPWIRQRTAMDDDKDYLYGASRVSRIIHRMHEAGYASEPWDQLAQMYAGWDTDLSPTIQSRTLLRGIPMSLKRGKRFDRLLWAARVRTTRTRREAWACFLESEASRTGPCIEVYLAMFEKLVYPPSVPQKRDGNKHDESAEADVVLPGDALEVSPEPQSATDLVYIREQVPSWEQLFYRMREQRIHPKPRAVAFLVETAPDIHLALDALRLSMDEFQGNLRRLLDGSIFGQESLGLPDYLVTAIIRTLCRFGRFAHYPHFHDLSSGIENERRLEDDPFYRVEYAYNLLVHFRPDYGPPWRAYLHAVLFAPWDTPDDRNLAQYRLLCGILRHMREGGIELDEEHFKMLCIALHNVAMADLDSSDLRHITSGTSFTSESHRIRALFHGLFSAAMDPITHQPLDSVSPVMPHVPDPTVLHAYVRALGAFNDYEGLYSFITWAVDNRHALSARMNLHRSGRESMWLVLVAIRAGLEGKLGKRHVRAAAELLQLVKSHVESVDGWAGWPSDQEVKLYLQAGRTTGPKDSYRSAPVH